MTPIGITHTGKLGDFYFSLPLASWLYKVSGRKIHWVLDANFVPFHKVESLLRLQEMTGDVTLVKLTDRHRGWGGVPVFDNPNEYGLWFDTYYNTVFKSFPDKFVTQYFANNCTRGNWDRDFVLNLGDITPSDEILRTEQDYITRAHRDDPDRGLMVLPDWRADVLTVLRRFAAAKLRLCGFSSVSVAMMFAKLPYRLYVYQDNGCSSPLERELYHGFRQELHTIIDARLPQRIL